LGYETGHPTDTDPGVFKPDLDPLTTTNPLLENSDADGINDGDEDKNHNGRLDAGESDPYDVIEWSGFRWNIKYSSELMGPGSNYWINSYRNIRVDDEGLHLKITEFDGKWYCSEIISKDSFGYGKYIFYLSSEIEDRFDDADNPLDTNVVLGFFTWDTNTCKKNVNSEIDIEFARWPAVANPNGNDHILNYSVQPTGERDGCRDRNNILSENVIPMQLNGSYTTHSIEWASDRVNFKSYYGHENPLSNPFGEWTYDNTTENCNSCCSEDNPCTIPSNEIGLLVPTADTKMRLNFWLRDADGDKIGNEPTDGKEKEIIVKSFVFVPSIDQDGDGIPDTSESQEPDGCPDPNDSDSDDDGIEDGVEDKNQNGIKDANELNPCSLDTDGDGIDDGKEIGLTKDDVGPNTDPDIFIPDKDPLTTTDPKDIDSDDDGVPDGVEDANCNGMVDVGPGSIKNFKGDLMLSEAVASSGAETDPVNIDSDGDGIQDGTEMGYTLLDIDSDTNTAIFQPDLDPTSTTDPFMADTDGDGISDGDEDLNKNGRVDTGETDPKEKDEDEVEDINVIPWLPLLLSSD